MIDDEKFESSIRKLDVEINKAHKLLDDLVEQYFEIPIDVDNKLWSDAKKLECSYWSAVVIYKKSILRHLEGELIKLGYTGLQKQ